MVLILVIWATTIWLLTGALSLLLICDTDFEWGFVNLIGRKRVESFPRLVNSGQLVQHLVTPKILF